MPATVTTYLKALEYSPYSPSRAHCEEARPKEKGDAYDERTWREHAHYDEKTVLFIPRTQFKFALVDAAAFVGQKVQGKGNATYTKHFRSGVSCDTNLSLGVKRDDVEGESFYCHADGKRTSGKRVWRKFPMVYDWKGPLRWTILDSTVTEEIFIDTLKHAGLFIGVGRYAPRSSGGGDNGKFKVERVEWKEIAI